MGLIRTILIIIGITVVVRFIGQLMIARRNIEEDRRAKAARDLERKQRSYVEKNKGKTTLMGAGEKKAEPFEDVDFEEVNK